MTMKELIELLNRLKVETGSLACAGCGREHNCSTAGCAIIRAAVDRLKDFSNIFSEHTLLNIAAQYLDTTPKRVADLVSLYKAGGIQIPPVQVGSEVWWICFDRVANEWVVDEEPERVLEVGTKGFFLSSCCECPEDPDEFHPFEEIGDECFLSHEAAMEAAAKQQWKPQRYKAHPAPEDLEDLYD